MNIAGATGIGDAAFDGDQDDARAAFDDIARAQLRRLFWLAYSILGNTTEAEDAVQETLMRAWRDQARMRHPGAVSAWMTTTCIRYCIRRRRLLAAWLRLGDRSVEAPLPPSTDVILLDLDRAARRLSPSQRAVLALHYQVGLSLDECASVMGRRPGTVRSHLSRALATLRTELSDA